MTKSVPEIYYNINETESQHFVIFKLLLSVMVMFVHSYVTPLNFAGGAAQGVQMSAGFAMVQYTISQCFFRCIVPGFFIVSAILFYRKSFVWHRNVWSKFKSLFVPYLILNLFWILLFAAAQQIPVLAPYFSRPDRIIANWGWRDFVSSCLLDPIPYHLWFLRDLFLLSLLAYAVDKVAGFAPKTFLTLLLLFWVFAADGKYCQSMQSICFWGIGCCMVKLDFHLEEVARFNRWIFYPFYLLLIAIDIWLLRSGGGYIYFTVHKLMMVVGVFFWYDLVIRFCGKEIDRRVLYIGSFSYGIFLIHEMGLSFTKKIITRLLPANELSALLQYLLIPFVITGVCLLICMAMKRWMPPVYTLLTGNRNR